MTPPLHVRRYEPPDENAVWTVHDRAFRASPMEFFPWYNRYLRHVPETFLDAGGEFLVGVVTERDGRAETETTDGRVVAIGGFLPVDDGGTRDDAIETDTVRTAELRSLRVDPSAQRRGYGKTLVRDLEHRARRRGFERMTLHTEPALAAAQAFYRSLGYEERHAATDDAAADGVVFERSL
ncbi:GNAT family N-acetyltransferase [Halomarina rubra]|uniref:GNAT family N-acetyltransferase n=1 Tax=Halomarina rubra TaxID=2071873 RepID=A0ABD6AT72_9EURY|nr:GNAT family N-acetyltransferase [Halomarina rubra]